MELRLLGEIEAPKKWWTAGTDVSREGKWNWALSTVLVGEFIWAKSNSNGGTRDNCLALSYVHDDTYKGSDWICSHPNHLFPMSQKKNV